MFEHGQLLQQLGDPDTNEPVERFRKFAFYRPEILESIAGSDKSKGAALSEVWGASNYVLKKYLAVHIAWSIEQGKFTVSSNQFYVTAGHLQTRYGTPLYLVFENNKHPGREPYCMVAAGANISAPQLPIPPEIPLPPEIPRGAEIVMMHDHILGKNADRVPYLSQTPPVAQMCAVAGAIQWSLNRDLHIPHWYYGQMSYLVPLYLQSREDITAAPDLIAPIQVNPDSLFVRTGLLPHMSYANARVAVKRHDQLPHWMLSAWANNADATEQEIEDPE